MNCVINANISDFNNIRSKGVKLLIKANLPNLEKLTLCKNIINKATCELGNEGAKHLSKNTWPNLKSIGYSNTFYYDRRELYWD